MKKKNRRLRGSYEARERQQNYQALDRLNLEVKRAIFGKTLRWWNASWWLNLTFKRNCPEGYVNKIIVYLPRPILEREVYPRLEKAFGDLK